MASTPQPWVGGQCWWNKNLSSTTPPSLKGRPTDLPIPTQLITDGTEWDESPFKDGFVLFMVTLNCLLHVVCSFESTQCSHVQPSLCLKLRSHWRQKLLFIRNPIIQMFLFFLWQYNSIFSHSTQASFLCGPRSDTDPIRPQTFQSSCA